MHPAVARPTHRSIASHSPVQLSCRSLGWGILRTDEFSGLRWEEGSRRAALADVMRVHEWNYVKRIQVGGGQRVLLESSQLCLCSRCPLGLPTVAQWCG